jgi:hypothetical protein
MGLTRSSRTLNLILLLGSTLVCLALLEGSLQVAYRMSSGTWLWKNTPFRIGYTKPIPDRREYALRESYQDAAAGLSIDAIGFRVTRPVPLPHQPLIICSGDSVPFGAGVPDEETYSSHLARILSARGVDVGVINAGVPSYNLRQSWDRVHLDVLPKYQSRPILVVTLEAANDISLLTYYGDDWSADKTWSKVRWAGTWAGPRFQRLAIVHYGARSLAAFRPPRSAHAEARTPGSLSASKTDAMLEHARQVLLAELTFFEGHSMAVVLLPIDPFYYQLKNQNQNQRLEGWQQYNQYVTEWDALIRRYNDVLREVSREFPNTYFFDSRVVMDAHDRNVLYLDYLHRSPIGNKILASALAEFLMERKLTTARKGARSAA